MLARSPITHADRIVTPQLVFQGANDVRTPQSDSDALVASPRARGVEVETGSTRTSGSGRVELGPLAASGPGLGTVDELVQVHPQLVAGPRGLLHRLVEHVLDQ